MHENCKVFKMSMPEHFFRDCVTDARMWFDKAIMIAWQCEWWSDISRGCWLVIMMIVMTVTTWVNTPAPGRPGTGGGAAPPGTHTPPPPTLPGELTLPHFISTEQLLDILLCKQIIDIPLFEVFILFGNGKGWKAFTGTFTFHFVQKVVKFSSHYFLGIRTSIPFSPHNLTADNSSPRRKTTF